MKFDFIFKWLMEMTRNQQEAYKRRNQTRINIINTMEKLRYKKDFQGNKKSYTVIYGNQEVGTYIGPKNPTPPQQLIRNLKNIDTDYVILDLGAGTHQFILDMFLLSPQGIIVSDTCRFCTLPALSMTGVRPEHQTSQSCFSPLCILS